MSGIAHDEHSSGRRLVVATSMVGAANALLATALVYGPAGLLPAGRAGAWLAALSMSVPYAIHGVFLASQLARGMREQVSLGWLSSDGWVVVLALNALPLTLWTDLSAQAGGMFDHFRRGGVLGLLLSVICLAYRVYWTRIADHSPDVAKWMRS